MQVKAVFRNFPGKRVAWPLPTANRWCESGTGSGKKSCPFYLFPSVSKQNELNRNRGLVTRGSKTFQQEKSVKFATDICCPYLPCKEEGPVQSRFCSFSWFCVLNIRLRTAQLICGVIFLRQNTQSLCIPDLSCSAAFFIFRDPNTANLPGQLRHLFQRDLERKPQPVFPLSRVCGSCDRRSFLSSDFHVFYLQPGLPRWTAALRICTSHSLQNAKKEEHFVGSWCCLDTCNCFCHSPR